MNKVLKRAIRSGRINSEYYIRKRKDKEHDKDKTDKK
jgi:hypothetical protein